jgi:hypothetical protein
MVIQHDVRRKGEQRLHDTGVGCELKELVNGRISVTAEQRPPDGETDGPAVYATWRSLYAIATCLQDDVVTRLSRTPASRLGVLRPDLARSVHRLG